MADIEAGMAVGYQLQWGSPMAFLTAWAGSACNYILPWRMFHIPGIFNYCDPHAPSLYRFIHHQIMGGPREEKERLHPGELTTYSSCYFYTPQSPSENLTHSHFTSCSLKPCAFGVKVSTLFSQSIFQLKTYTFIYIQLKIQLFLHVEHLGYGWDRKAKSSFIR